MSHHLLSVLHRRQSRESSDSLLSNLLKITMRRQRGFMSRRKLLAGRYDTHPIQCYLTQPSYHCVMSRLGHATSVGATRCVRALEMRAYIPTQHMMTKNPERGMQVICTPVRNHVLQRRAAQTRLTERGRSCSVPVAGDPTQMHSKSLADTIDARSLPQPSSDPVRSK